MLAHLPSPAVPPAAVTILVADARDMMARLLRPDGYKSVTAADGEAALAAVEADHPDLMLLDLTMPGMDGLEVLRRLRADARSRDLPVVMFTAVRDARLVDEARRLVAADYVVKGSLGAADLMDLIARCLPHDG